jgi:hypothetical protein
MNEIYRLRSAIVHGADKRTGLWKKVNIDDVEEKLRVNQNIYEKIGISSMPLI